MTEEKSIDFGNEESRKNYLVTKFDDLFQGINNLYGKELMEELLQRMEKTIAIFHQDVKSMLKDLKPAEEQKPVGGSGKPALRTGVVPEIHSEVNPSIATDANDWAKHLS